MSILGHRVVTNEWLARTEVIQDTRNHTLIMHPITALAIETPDPLERLPKVMAWVLERANRRFDAKIQALADAGRQMTFVGGTSDGKVVDVPRHVARVDDANGSQYKPNRVAGVLELVKAGTPW